MAMTELPTSADGVARDVGGFVGLLGKPILLLLAGLTGNFYLVFGLLLGFGVLSFIVLLFTVKGSKKRGRRKR